MKILTCLLIITILFVIATSSLTNAKLCKEEKHATVWKHAKGSFKNVGGNKWKEFNDKNVPNSETFEELLIEPSQIVIYDKIRDVQILLKDDLAGIKHGGGANAHGNFQQLYQGTWQKVISCL